MADHGSPATSGGRQALRSQPLHLLDQESDDGFRNRLSLADARREPPQKRGPHKPRQSKTVGQVRFYVR
jgi:hypothetical protein